MQYKVRFVNPQKQYHNQRRELLTTIDDVFSRGDLIMRKDLVEFEERFARFVGVKYAIGVNSGTDALILSMKAAGIVSGDEVITVSHTFMASISAIYHQGAEPVLVDVGEDYTMNPDLLEKAISPKTKAIEPVHLNGRTCDMEKIMAVAKKNHLLVIEDAAQALGARFKTKGSKWRMAGSFGLAGCFSMYPFKILGAFGDAGMVATNSLEIAKKVRLLRFNGEDKEDGKFYLHGYTSLLDNVQAALLNVKFKYLRGWIVRRREIARIYWNGLKNIPQVKLPHFSDPRRFDVYQNYVLRAGKRNDLFDYLNEKGIETLIKDRVPNHWQKELKFPEIKLPLTEQLSDEVISLPLYPELKNIEVEYVIKSVREFYRKN